jgi:hypothetical protein
MIENTPAGRVVITLLLEMNTQEDLLILTIRKFHMRMVKGTCLKVEGEVHLDEQDAQEGEQGEDIGAHTPHGVTGKIDRRHRMIVPLEPNDWLGLKMQFPMPSSVGDTLWICFVILALDHLLRLDYFASSVYDSCTIMMHNKSIERLHIDLIIMKCKS